MAPTNKAKAAGVSASSFFDLKAELSKKEEEFSKAKASGKTALVGGVKRPDKVCSPSRKVRFSMLVSHVRTETHSMGKAE